MKKNYYGRVLALTVAASMVSVPAFAAEENGKEAAVQAEGGIATLPMTDEVQPVVVAEPEEEQEGDAPAEEEQKIATHSDENAEESEITSAGGELQTGAYILKDNVDLTNNLVIPDGAVVMIDLNGHTLKGNGSGSVITVNGGKLTLKDTTVVKKTELSDATAGVVKNNDGTYTATYAVYDKDDTLTYQSYTSGVITGGKGAEDNQGGGIHVNGGTVVMDSGMITGNAPKEEQSYALGGGVYVTAGGTFTMNDGAISGNTAYSSTNQGSGGGVYIDIDSSFTMNGGVFCHNTSNGKNTSSAGAVYVQRAGTFKANNGIFSGNTARLAGVIYGTPSGTTELENCVLVENKTKLYGGAIAGGNLTLEDCVISHNSTVIDGGGLYIMEDKNLKTGSTLKNCYIQKNTVECNETPTDSWIGGAGIVTAYHDGEATELNITDCTIRDNYASLTADSEKAVFGGGIHIESGTKATINNTAILNNSVQGQKAYGGGLYTSSKTETVLKGTTEISNNTVNGTVMSSGGGVYMGSDGTITMESGEISNNSAGQGGGVTIGNGSAGSATVFNMNGGTITQNKAVGGLQNSDRMDVVNNGGGILIQHWSQAECNFSGDAVVVGNTGQDKENNLYFGYPHVAIKGSLSAKLGDKADIRATALKEENDRVIFNAKDGYVIAPADLSHIQYEGDTYVAYLDTADNTIKIGIPDKTITFDANSGEGTMEAQKIISGKTHTLAANEFTRKKYVFNGWNSQQDGTGTSYTDKQEVTASGDITLYAQWTECTSHNFEDGVCTKCGCKEAKIELSATSGSARVNRGPVTFTYTYDGDGEVSVASDDESVATAEVDPETKTVTVTLHKVGTAKITVSAAESANYNAAQATYDLTVQKKKSSSSSSDTTTDKDNNKTDTDKTPDTDKTTDGDQTKDDTAAEQGKTIKLQIGSRIVTVDNEAVIYDVAPVIRNDRTLVPIRIITETLGGKVDWNGATKEVTLTLDGKEIKMTIGKTLEKYGVAPVIIDGRTFVPVRFVADELGATVAWDDATKTVTIKTAR